MQAQSSPLMGRVNRLIWTQRIPNTESSNSLAVGYFNDDKVPDFFTFVSKGEWPNNVGSFQIMFNGIDGSIGFKDSIGCTGFSSPVVYDLNSDGIDEAIISINEFDCNKGFVTEAIQEIENKVVAINFRDRTLQAIDQARGFKNIFSTPWLGDLDADGYLDLVYCQYFSRGGLLVFLGMRTKRVETPIKINKIPTMGCIHGNTRHWSISHRSVRQFHFMWVSIKRAPKLFGALKTKLLGLINYRHPTRLCQPEYQDLSCQLPYLSAFLVCSLLGSFSFLGICPPVRLPG